MPPTFPSRVHLNGKRKNDPYICPSSVKENYHMDTNMDCKTFPTTNVDEIYTKPWRILDLKGATNEELQSELKKVLMCKSDPNMKQTNSSNYVFIVAPSVVFQSKSILHLCCSPPYKCEELWNQHWHMSTEDLPPWNGHWKQFISDLKLTVNRVRCE